MGSYRQNRKHYVNIMYRIKLGNKDVTDEDSVLMGGRDQSDEIFYTLVAELNKTWKEHVSQMYRKYADKEL